MTPFLRLASEFNLRFGIFEKDDCPLSIIKEFLGL
jgi:hypothetical protein